MDPSEALRGFLEALGVSRGELPASLDGQAAMYRTLLSGRRVLVVLDNARDSGQGALAAPRDDHLPGHRHQPPPAVRPGGGWRPAASSRAHASHRGEDVPDPPSGRGPGFVRAISGQGDHCPVRRAAACPGHRGRQGGAAPSVLAAHARGGAARSAQHDGRRNLRYRCPRGLLVRYSMHSIRPRRGCSGCLACIRARTSAPRPPRHERPRRGGCTTAGGDGRRGASA